MRPNPKYANYAAALILAASTAGAQLPSRTERAGEFSRSVSYNDYLKGKDVRSSELVGERVHNATGDALGEIKELVIPANRERMLVILSVGGLGDLRDKLVAVPYDDLRVSPAGDHFFFDRTEEQLKAAPEFSYEAAQPATTRTAADRPRVTAPNSNPAKSENLALDTFDYRASDLIGAMVLDDRGEHVAKVDDIVVSTEDGNPQVRIKMTRDQLQQLVNSRAPFHYERQVAKAPGNAPRG